MKFRRSLSSEFSDASLGEIYDIKRLPNRTLKTPLALVYTRGGSVPHLTREVLDLAFNSPLPVLMPSANIAHAFESIQNYGKGMASFAGLSGSFMWCSQMDHGSNTPSGYQQKDKISLWTRFGRKQYSSDSYMDLLEALKPDLYTILSCNDINSSTSSKKIHKSVDTSISLMHKCLQRHEKSMELKNSGVFVAVQGGFNVKERVRSAESCASAPVDGFVIDGFFTDGSKTEELTFDIIQPLIEATLEKLPKDKIKAVYGAWNPDTVLKLVDCGIDLFDTSLAYLASERGCALNFKYSKALTRYIPTETPQKKSFNSLLLNGNSFCDRDIVNGDSYSDSETFNGNGFSNSNQTNGDINSDSNHVNDDALSKVVVQHNDLNSIKSVVKCNGASESPTINGYSKSELTKPESNVCSNKATALANVRDSCDKTLTSSNKSSHEGAVNGANTEDETSGSFGLLNGSVQNHNVISDVTKISNLSKTNGTKLQNGMKNKENLQKNPSPRSVSKYYPYEFSLHEARFKSDFSPIDSNCTCFTCKKHTRAYIHHLLNTKELLARVLLMIHNLHHCFQFFDNIHYNIENYGKAYI